MAEFPQLRPDVLSSSSKPNPIPSQIEPVDYPDAVAMSDPRRRPRPKLASYITGQRTKANPTAFQNKRADSSSPYPLAPWQSTSFSQDLPCSAAPPEIDRLLESILKHVLANPFQPLPVNFNSALSYIIEAFQNLRGELTRLKDALSEENALRQAAEESWAMEREALEREIKRLDRQATSGQDAMRTSNKKLKALVDLNRVDELRYPTRSGARSDFYGPCTPEKPTLRSSRSELALNEDFLLSDPHNSNRMDTLTAQDAMNLQAIACIIARRHSMSMADVWDGVTHLYFDRFKESDQGAQTPVAQNLNMENKTAGDRPPLATILNIPGRRRNFSFKTGDDSALLTTSSNLPLKPSQTGSPRQNVAKLAEGLLHSGISPQSSILRSTTPEFDKRTGDCWRRSRIPSPAQDCSFLARPRRESSASSMLTTVNTSLENQSPINGDVPKVSVTPVNHLEDDTDDCFDMKPGQIQELMSPRVPLSERNAPKRLLQTKSAESLKKVGEARFTTSTLARKMKNIGNGSKSPAG